MSSLGFTQVRRWSETMASGKIAGWLKASLSLVEKPYRCYSAIYCFSEKTPDRLSITGFEFAILLSIGALSQPTCPHNYWLIAYQIGNFRFTFGKTNMNSKIVNTIPIAARRK